MVTLLREFPDLPNGWMRRTGWLRDPFDGGDVSLIQHQATGYLMLQAADGRLSRVPEEWAQAQMDPAA